MHYKKSTRNIGTTYARYIAVFLVVLLVVGVAVIAYPSADRSQYHEVYTTITIPKGQSLVDAIPDGPSLEGYVFLHWSYRPSDAAFDLAQPLYQDTTLYAIWLNQDKYEYNIDSWGDYHYYHYDYGYNYAYAYHYDYTAYHHYGYVHEAPQYSSGHHYHYYQEDTHPYTHAYYQYEHHVQGYYYHNYGYNYAYVDPSYYEEHLQHEAPQYYSGYHYYYQEDAYPYADMYPYSDVYYQYEHHTQGYYYHYNYRHNYGYINEVPQYSDGQNYNDSYNTPYYLQETVTITFMWNRGARQMTSASIEIDSRANVTVAMDMEYMVILDGDYIHIRFPKVIDNIDISIANSAWTYEVSYQDEEVEVHDEYGYATTETITYTVVTVTHDILSRNYGYLGIMPLASNLPAGFNLNILAPPFDNQSWINAAGTNTPGNNIVIAIPQDVPMPNQVTISGTRHVIITSIDTNLNESLTNHSAPPTTFVINFTSNTGRHFLIGAGATLTLSHIILDGGVIPPATTHTRGGVTATAANTHLYMLQGSVIRHSRATTGGGLNISNTGNFSMHGNASITANAATGPGGGVNVAAGARIVTMSGSSSISNNIATGANGIGGGINLAANAAHLTMNAGTSISNNTASTSGGGVNISVNGSRLTINGGIISGNTAYGTGLVDGGGGVNILAIVTNTDTFTFNSGSIINNTAVSNGGGIFAGLHSYLNPLPTGAFPQLNIQAAAIFNGNTAGNGGFTPPSNAVAASDIPVTAQRSGGFAHPINNLDINFFNETADWRRLNNAINFTTAATIIIHPTGTTGVSDGLTGTTYNLIISDPGNGSTITTVGITGGISPHVINVPRSVTVQAAAGTNISLRMPVPGGAPGMPTQAPWTTDTVLLSRHFNVAGGTFTLGAGAGGTLTIDGNVDLVIGAGFRGGVSVAANGGLVLQAGGIIQNNRASNGGGVALTAATSVFTMTGGTIQNNIGTSTGGGVDVRGGGRFYMRNGNIINNTVTSTTATDGGGGVYVTTGVIATPSTFIMDDDPLTPGAGTRNITGNSAHNGGGVHINNLNAVFTMGGSSNISNNTTPLATNASNGLGVRISAGHFTMNGGTISNNLRPPSFASNATNGGGVFLIGASSHFTMNSGTISGHTVATSGGGVHVANGAQFTMNNAGSNISGNTSTATALNSGGGGVFVTGAASRFFFNGGTIQNNHAATYGGGIFATEATHMNPLPAGTFPQLYVQAAAVFANNTAGRGSSTPPANAAAATQIAAAASSGGYLHPLNNLDINFFVVAADWFLLNNAIRFSSADRIIIHPTGSTVTPGLVGTDFNIIISDPGDGYTITTILTGAFVTHSIDVTRPVTLAAAPGANIVLRMPVPDSPNTPSQAPWVTDSEGLSRHFEISGSGHLILGGGPGYGTLTVDGNVRSLPGASNAVRGGINVNANGNLTMQAGGAVYSNRWANGGGVTLNNATAIFNMAGGSISNNISTANGGGVALIANGATFTMSGGNISDNTATVNGGGVSLNADNTHFNLNGGTIDGNTANSATQGGGGIFVSGLASRVHFNSGTISNNSVPNNGAGIFATEFSTHNPLPAGSFPQLTVSTSAVFSGNIAGAGGNTPPSNAAAATLITNGAGRSGGFLHPLNNLDINYFFSNSDWARLERLILDPAGPTTILLHPTGAGVSPGLSGTTYNFIITDPGGGSLITTISLQGGMSPHDIDVLRPLTIAAATGANITIRMPVPGAPNTPNETPWITTMNSVQRHFTIRNGGNLTLGGGAGLGTLTLDGNANQNTSNRGGIVVYAGATLTVQAGGVIYNNRMTNGGGVSLPAASSVFNMTGGSITHNFAVNSGGGVALTMNGAQFTMNGGSITNNIATNTGGGVSVGAGASSLFSFNGGTISNNSAAIGGGVFVTTATYEDPLPAGIHFPQIAVSSIAVFTGNIAHSGGYEPPTNADTNTNIQVTAQVSGGFWHPLNNMDINFLRTMDSDWRRISDAITGIPVLGTVNIVIHPAGTTGVTDGFVGSTYNLIISDPGDGNTITTTQLNTDVFNHTIQIFNRTVTISAGSGADIIIRMPAPGYPNTPGQIPWLSGLEAPGRHFRVRAGGNLTLYGGTGTVTLDGNADIVPITINGHRGGIDVMENNALLVLNTGGIIYNNRAIGNNMTYGGGGGVDLIGNSNNYTIPATFRMYGGYIQGNYARHRGGGVSLDSNQGIRANFIMTGGHIRDNRSSNMGGGISVCCGVRAWIHGGYIYNNIANNGGGMFIGEIATPYNHVAIHGGEIHNNTARYNGGGLHTGNLTGNRTTITGGHIHSNNAASLDPTQGSGGGIYHHAGRLFLFGGRINNNSASRSGGGIYSTDNPFDGGIGEFVMDINRQVVRNLYTQSDGLPIGNNPVEVPNPNFPSGRLEVNNNRARYNGGGVSLMTASVFDEFNTPFTVCDLVEIDGNTAGMYGGGIYLGNQTRHVYMTGGTVANNGHPAQVYINTGTPSVPVLTPVSIRTRNGGGVFINDGIFTMFSGYITGNAALGHYTLDPSNNQIWTGGYGGGVHMGTNASSFYITDYIPAGGGAPVPGVINFIGNQARVGGAVHYFHGNWSYTGNTGPVNFTGNSATQRGGALAITNNRVLAINQQWTFSSNSSAIYGGAIYLNSSIFNMSGGLIGGIPDTVAGNTAVQGAGVYASAGSVFNMTGGTIRLNTASATGGGLATSDGRTVFNMHGGEISRNTAVHGGGIGMMLGSNVNITPQGGGQPVILGNTATYGGGVHVYGVEDRPSVPTANHGASTLTMNGGTIGGPNIADANIATQSGGGIFVGSSTITTAGPGRQTRNTAILNSGSVITRNIANAAGSSTINGGGGGIYVTIGGQLNATDAHITSNSAPNGMGGGIFTELFEYLNPLASIAPGTPADQRAYRNLNLVGITFSGNTSSALHHPAVNANVTTLPHIGFLSTSPAAPHPGNYHPLNNDDINYVRIGVANTFYFHKTNTSVDVPNPVLLPGAQFVLVQFNGIGTPPVGMVTPDMIGNGLNQWTQIGGTHTSSSVASEPMAFDMVTYSYYHIIEVAPPVGFQMPMGQWRARATNNGATLTITNISDLHMPSIWGPITMQDAQGENISVRMIGNILDFELPLSGGTGATRFTIAGSVVIALAFVLGIVVIAKRHRFV